MNKFSSAFAGNSLPTSTSALPSKFLLQEHDITLLSSIPIGVGGSAHVFKGRFKDQIVAIKKYMLDAPTHPKSIRLLHQETIELTRLEHPNIIRCLGLCEGNGQLVLELAEKQILLSTQSYDVHSLRQLLDLVGENLPIQLKFEALRQVAEGLVYLHGKNIIHGDLKSGNVLISGGEDEWEFKLADFGQAHRAIALSMSMSRSSLPSSTNRKGTISFEGPEVFLSGKKSTKSDMYSFGMVMVELANPTASYPWESVFNTSSPDVINTMIIEAVKKGQRPALPDNISPELSNVINQCWKQSELERPAAKEVAKIFTDLLSSLTPSQVGPADDVDSTDISITSETSDGNNVISPFKRPSPLSLQSSHQMSNNQANSQVNKRPSTNSRRQLLFENQRQSERDVHNNDSKNGSSIRYDDREGPSQMRHNSNEKSTSVERSDTVVENSVEDLTVESTIAPATEAESMLWGGYAAQHLKIIPKPFQIEAVNAYSKKRDVLIIQGTGAGKSACFTLPIVMIPKNSEQVVLILVPTVALAINHQQKLTEIGIPSVFFNGDSTKEDYTKTFGPRPSTRVVILTPEFLFGTEDRAGIIGRFQKCKALLHLIVIDEAHLVYDWEPFRPSYGQVKQLKTMFDCPIMALSATLKPSNRQSLCLQVLRSPIIVKGSLDRRNVMMHMLPYTTSSGNDSFSPVAKQIKSLANTEKSIVYCATAKDCAQVEQSLKNACVNALLYTGKHSQKEKREVLQKLAADDCKIVVATQALGHGIDFSDVRNVFHIGLPPSISDLIQSSGRAGRDGKPADLYVLVNENKDKDKLAFWIKQSNTSEETSVRLEDYQIMWKYFSSAFVGDCQRQFHLNYFEDNSAQPTMERNASNCCTGCEIFSSESFKPAVELLRILQVLDYLGSRNIKAVYESYVIEWVQGKQATWLWSHFNHEDLVNVPDSDAFRFGCLKTLTDDQAKLLVKGILRQCLAKNFVDVKFRFLPGNNIMVKAWSITDEGSRMSHSETNLINLPDPIKMAKRLLRTEDSAASNRTTKKRQTKEDSLYRRTVKMMQGNECDPLESKEQYELLGFHHDTSKLLYVQDLSQLPGCPIVPVRDFLWNDISLSKDSGFPQKTFRNDEGQEFVLRRARCNGVKVCQGETTGEPCTFAVSNQFQKNNCVEHYKTASLKSSGPCPSYFVYVQPTDPEDKRRWLGCLLKEGKGQHNHPNPGRKKIGTKLDQMIQQAVTDSPTLTASDISKGEGIGCNPASVSLPAAKISNLQNAVKKARTNTYASCSDKNLLQNFDALIKNRIDEKDAQNAESQEMNEQVLTLCTPYLRDTNFTANGDFAFLATPQMLEVLNESRFVEVDVTFPTWKWMKYEMNFVAFNYETLQYQPVFRVLLTRLDTASYNEAFRSCFRITTNIHPEFNQGKDVVGWVMDFSVAQRQGLEANLGQQNAAESIRGCQVHFQRCVDKVAKKVNKDEKSKAIFKRLAYLLPYLKDEDNVFLAFDILTGTKDLDDEEVEFFLSNQTNITQEDLFEVDTSLWHLAQDWKTWWLKPKTRQMIFLSFSDMLKADLKVCPRTTNAVESQNRLSAPGSKSFHVGLSRLFSTDKTFCYRTLAVRNGISVGISLEERKEINNKRRGKKRRLPVLLEEENSDSDAEDSSVVKKKKKDSENDREGSIQSDPAQSQTISSDENGEEDKEGSDEEDKEETEDESEGESKEENESEDESEEDEYIGKLIFVQISTSRTRRSLGWQGAKIIKKDENGQYHAKIDDSKRIVIIPDISDTNRVVFEVAENK